jgi:hypothetical protein
MDQSDARRAGSESEGGAGEISESAPRAGTNIIKLFTLILNGFFVLSLV